VERAKLKFDYEPLIEEWGTYNHAKCCYNHNKQEKLFVINNNGEFINDEFEIWRTLEELELRQIFDKEYNKLIEKKEYFYGCPFTDYKETYLLRLTDFLYDFIDANEIDFIDYELNKEIRYEYVNPKTIQSIIYSIKLRNYFLNNKKEFLINSNKPEPLEQPVITDTKNSLNWQGTSLQFAELTKSLIETKLISPELTQKEFFKRMKHFFNVAEFDEGEKLKDIRGRTNTTTPLLNILETSLNNWIKKKD